MFCTSVRSEMQLSVYLKLGHILPSWLAGQWSQSGTGAGKEENPWARRMLKKKKKKGTLCMKLDFLSDGAASWHGLFHSNSF